MYQRRSMLLFVCLLMVGGCSQEPPKTDSMLHLEKVQKQAQILIEKLDDRLSADVVEAPPQHVSDIFYAYELLIRIDEVYRRGQVQGLRPAVLDALQTKLHSLSPALASHSIGLLHQLVDQTLSLRQKIAAIKMAEVGAAKAASDTSLAMAAKAYHQEIETCCLQDLYKIRQMLARHPQTHYAPLLRVIDNVTNDLALILKDPAIASAYKDKLASLSSL